MIVIRPAALADLDALEHLATEAGIGMTTLPRERELLRHKIEASLASFASAPGEPGEELYFFVLEDTAGPQVVGCCAIIAAIGLSRPFYSFRIIHLTHTSRDFGKYEPVRALQMVDEYRGSTEIGTLYLTPAARRDRNGRFLSRSRFLFLAEYPERFAARVVAEMRGVQDEHGHSMFWENLGQHFIQMSFSKADYLSSVGEYQFIADLMPKYPVYVQLLPAGAQKVIGITHDATRPALELLKREGFRFEGCVDVFDAGPTIACPLQAIHTVRDSMVRTIGAINEPVHGTSWMVSNCRLDAYRACRAHIEPLDDDRIMIDLAAAEALRVEPGDRVRLAAF